VGGSALRGVLGSILLAALRKGDRGEIVGLDDSGVGIGLPPGELERRLLEMGLVEGARVEVIHEGFPGRDPFAVCVEQHTVALRRAEARAVVVSRLT
jgi:ferrous iron transport protein A